MTLSRSRIVIFILIATLSLSVPMFAAQDVARQTGAGQSVQWQVKVTGQERAVLTVVGPDGTAYVKTFGAGQDPSFSITDLGGSPDDGDYNYELRIEPKVSAGVKAQLAAARANNDDAAIKKIQKDAGLADLRMSGNLKIVNGGFVSNEGTESGATAGGSRVVSQATVSSNAVRPGRIEALDQVIPDDLIVQSSTCTGFDCVDGESFGFDTLRLKENNLRIHFEDTSTSAGFPSNDWRIVANDTTSGGADKFVIEDSTAARNPMTIEAGSPANTLYVDSAGRIGIQQGAPVLDLHITNGNTPAVRLEQTSAGGFTAQTWDIGANEANFFVRDITGGSRLPFRIRPGAPTSSIDINASGNVGIGTASPARLLHLVSSTGNASLQLTNSSAKSWHIANATNDLNVSETGVADARFYLQAGGNVGIACNAPGARLVVASGGGCSTPSSSLNPGDAQFTVASSRTFKENISPIAVPDVLEKIGKVGVYNYDYIGGPKDRIGLIAEDFHEVLGRGDEKYINGGDVQVALWLAVQQLTAQNKALTERVNALDKELSSQEQPQQ